MCCGNQSSFWLHFKNIEDGGFRFFYAHENHTLLDRSKFVWSLDDLIKLKESLNKTDVIELCSWETLNTKWRFFKLTNFTVFAALLKDLPKGCRDAVLPESLLKNCKINCFRYEEKKHNHITASSVFFVLLLSICTKTNDWKEKLQKLSIHP